jgi:hypothetical protein
MAIAGEQPNPIMIALHDQAEAIVFYFMQPIGMVGDLGAACWDIR